MLREGWEVLPIPSIMNHSLSLLPTFLPQFPAPAENWVPSEAKLPLNLFHQLHNASNPGSGGDG